MSKQRRKTALMGKLLDQVRTQFQRVTTGDSSQAHAFTAADCLMCGLAIFLLKYPSLLKFDARLREARVRANLRRLVGVAHAPSDTTMRRRLDAIESTQVHRALRTLFGWLLRHRQLEPFRLADGALPLAVDGTGYITSTKVHCDRCLTKQTRNGETHYWHAILGAVVISPDRQEVVPAAVEPITNADGTKKQDCEQHAFKRLLPRLLKERQGTRFVVIADALHANAPTVQLLRKHEQDFILTVKDKSHAHALDQLVEAAYQDDPDDTLTRYRWRQDVQLNASHGDACRVTLVEQESWNRRSGKSSRWTWVTNRNVTSVAEARVVARLGRARWHIENNVYKTLKGEDGYHFEHNYGHGQHHLCTNMMLLMFLAFTIDQVNALGCRRFQAARQHAGATYALWEEQRVAFRLLVWDSWDMLYDRMADIPPDT